MRAPARLSLVGSTLFAALSLTACGSEGPDPTSSGALTSRSATAPAENPRPRRAGQAGRPVAGPCQSQLGSFVASMDSLRRRLAVGVTFDQYRAEVRGIGSTYDRIPISRVQIDCLTAVGTPGENAFNRYIEAANAWGECVAEAGCTSATVEPGLQRRWRIASDFLSEAEAGLDASALRGARDVP